MPKRMGNIYERMCDKETIRKCILKGATGKKRRHDVRIVLEDLNTYVDKTYELLVSGTYKPTIPKIMRIKDASSGKEREISIVPYFPDGIIHQLCVYAMKQVLMRGMYHWSCASIPGRGNAHAIRYIKKCLKKDTKGTKYCAKLDIYHFYPSIQPRVLIWALARKIKDKKFLRLVYEIINSNKTDGLAIGYYLNQWLANYLLEPLDHFICARDGVKHYVRNMDDLILMGPNKKKLHKAVKEIALFLGRFRLKLKNNWQVFPVEARGIDFVGYRFYHERTVLRRRNFLKLAKQSRRVFKLITAGKRIPLRTAAGLLSRSGQLKHCNGTAIRQKYIDPIGAKTLKDVIRRKQNQTDKTAVVSCLRPSAV